MKKNQLSHIRTLRILLASGALVATLVGARAQTAPTAPTEPQEEAVKLSPFVVSSENENGYRSQQTLVGFRSVKDLADIPASISIINSAMISDLAATNLSDLMSVGTAGVAQNQTGTDDYSIRGFRSSSALRDGVTKTNYKRNGMFDVERVEVLKGPVALTLGNNSFIGGAINMVTRSASEKLEGDAKLTVSDRNYVRLAVNQTGPIYHDDNFKANYRLTVGVEKGDREKEVEFYDQEFVGGQMKLLFGDRTIITINGSILKDGGNHYYQDFTDANSATAAHPYAIVNRNSGGSTQISRRKDTWQKTEEVFMSVEGLTRLSDNSSLRTFIHYVDYQDIRREIIGTSLVGNTLNRTNRPHSLYNVDLLGQLDYIHELKRKSFNNTFMVGADMERYYQRQKLRAVNSPLQALDVSSRDRDWTWDEANLGTVPSFAGPAERDRVSRSLPWSWYVQDNLTFFDGKLSLVGGSRFFSTYSTNLEHTTGVMTEAESKHFRGDKYAILFKPLPYLSVYAGKTTTILPQTGYTTEEIPQPFNDQEGSNKEVGVKLDHKFSDKVTMFGSVALFDMAITNVRTLTNQINSRGEGITLQSAKDSSKGWEFEGGANFQTDGGRLQIIANYYHNKSYSANLDGPAPQAVPYSYGGLAKYTWTGGALKGLDFGASLSRQGESRGNGGSLRQMIPAYPVTYNLFASYQWNKKWSFQLNWDNVTDERYIVNVARQSAIMLNDPGRVRLTAKYAW